MTRLAGAHVNLDDLDNGYYRITAYRDGRTVAVELPTVSILHSTTADEILDAALDALDNLLEQRGEGP